MYLKPNERKPIGEQLDEQIEQYSSRTLDRDDEVLIEIYGELREMINESESPRLYVFGRSSAGKSSLVNALAGKSVADVGPIKPVTTESEVYDISFADGFSMWEVIDSRGLFESVAADGRDSVNTVEMLNQDIREYRPDVLIHVITPGQVRSGENDFKLIESLKSEFREGLPPLLYCLNKVDTHALPQQWPPEEHPELSDKIGENVRFLSESILGEHGGTPLFDDVPYKGHVFPSSKNHIGVIPAQLQVQDSYWNVETIKVLIGEELPDSKQLQFYQDEKDTYLMRTLAEKTTERFADLATKLGEGSGTPTPEEIHLKLIGLIGSYSGRDLTTETVMEYLREINPAATSTGGPGLTDEQRKTLSEIEDQHAEAAAKATMAIGRSAHQYFFDDIKQTPASIVN